MSIADQSRGPGRLFFNIAAQQSSKPHAAAAAPGGAPAPTVDTTVFLQVALLLAVVFVLTVLSLYLPRNLVAALFSISLTAILYGGIRGYKLITQAQAALDKQTVTDEGLRNLLDIERTRTQQLKEDISYITQSHSNTVATLQMQLNQAKDHVHAAREEIAKHLGKLSVIVPELAYLRQRQQHFDSIEAERNSWTFTPQGRPMRDETFSAAVAEIMR